MNRKILYLLLLMLVNVGAHAQRQSAFQIGFIGAQKQVNFNAQDSSYILISGGHVVGTQTDTLIMDELNMITGFPYPVKYFAQTFDEKFFVSKGFFPDVVQMNWTLKSKGDRIQRFLLYRKPLGSEGDSLLVATLGSAEFSFRDEYVEGGVLYKYTLFAQGIADELRLPFINYIEGTGFAYPVGTATGRVTFEGGTAVEGVTVLAETEGNLRGKSVYLNGEDAYLRMLPTAKDKELQLQNGFTLQMWTRFEGTEKGILFNQGNDIELAYDGDTLYFKLADAEAKLGFKHPVDSFFHVSAVYSPVDNYVALYTRVNHLQVDSLRVDAGTVPAASLDFFFFGRNREGNYYKGYLDEMRLWSRPLSFEETGSNYSRYLAGTEKGFAAYWRLDAGIAGNFYDFSRQGGFNFNENHGQLLRTEWSEVTPLNSQLAFRGVTDANGNYTITGFPFETSGSLYTFTPILDNHTFEPNQQLRFVGDGEFIFNEVNFKDISSFPVSGIITYRNTPFPVEGVSIMIDGKPAVDSEGEIIISDKNGKFKVDVPIGFHSLKASRYGHGFENEGRFPPPVEDEEIPLFNFQEPLAGLTFIDTTLVRLAGRVVGGPVEAAKPVGFGLSKNNIGKATITLRPEKLADLTFREFDSLIVNEEKHINTNTTFNVRDIKVYPDTISGEFVTFLPPERYVVTSVNTKNYPFDDDYKVAINLVQTLAQHEIRQDTVLIAVKEKPLDGFPPFKASDYDTVFTTKSADTVFTVAVDTFKLDHRQDFILRLPPSIEVTNEEGGEVFGDTKYVYQNDNLNLLDSVPLIDASGNYTFGHPVFSQQNRYTMRARLFEEYYDDHGNLDQVPVTDGKLKIINNFAAVKDKELELDGKGEAVYTFTAGMPNLNTDPLDPANNFTQTLNVTAFSGNNGSLQTIWREESPLRGIVFGGIPLGNNFVTKGPQEVIAILRDPPGSGSQAFLEKGTTISNTNSWALSEAVETTTALQLTSGTNQKTILGIGTATFNETSKEVESDNQLVINQSFEGGESVTNTVTTTQVFSTSDDPALVGSAGDVFIGSSTNIVFGETRNLGVMPTALCENCPGASVNNFSIGISEGIHITPEFETDFVYTQSHIENTLLPNLKRLRNKFLIYSTHADTIQSTSSPVYISLVPSDDEKFGSDNDDEDIWGSQAKTNPLVAGTGPSYIIKVPASLADKDLVDSVAFYNKEIKEWEFWLEENEKQKVTAQLDKNFSFDGGVTIEESVQTIKTETTTRTWTIDLGKSLSFNTNTEISPFGVKMKLLLINETSINFGQNYGQEEMEELSTTYGFALSDGDVGDSYTVDVLKPKDGFGPVFKIRGGVSSCPYEGEEKTRFYKPGSTLHFPTIRREKLSLSVENAVVSNVPENREAEFVVRLNNDSETGEDTFYDLHLDDASNPYGAIVSVGGLPLGNGRSFMVHASQSLIQTLKVGKGQQDVLDYEDLKLILTSQCDETIADTISLSAYFQPGCSDVALELPADQWVLNSRAAQKDTLLVKITKYDLNFENFNRIVLQTKPASSSVWTTRMNFYNPQQVSEEDFDELQDPKQFIQSTEILYALDMNDMPDREYDIRAVTKCVLGPGVEVETPSEIIRGIKDVERPKLFGTPQPADGILSAGDEIMIQFDEPIEAGLLNYSNFSIKGVLNNTPLTSYASVSFDGVDDYARIEDGLDLRGRSFTITFWLRRQVYGQEYVVVSKGNYAEDAFEVGFTAANQLFVEQSGERMITSLTFPDQGIRPWEHYAVVYDAENNAFSAYRNGEYILEEAKTTRRYSGTGPLVLGKSVISNDRYFNGNMYELRFWSKASSLSEVVAGRDVMLSGNEMNLIGYWPMDEAFGQLALDKARYRHAKIFADWLVEPKGYAYTFDGADDYVEMNTASTVVISDEQDFTIEFWFKGSPGQGEAVLFSNGKGDGSAEGADPHHTWTIGFDASGQMVIANNGNVIAVGSQEDKFLDNDWHHFALSVNRIGNANVFVDLAQKVSVPVAGYGGLMGSRMWFGARGYRETNVTAKQDKFFKGSIDEFRIWNSFRRKEQLGLNWLNKLSGDEVGLAAYYPFDAYARVSGINMLQKSLEDQFINPYGANGGVASAYGGADFDGNNTANIKQARPVAEIDFDYVVNEDKIILTPSENFAPLIEQTVLEISVRTVEDQFENRLASPVTWTAFVDKNQVKWGEEMMAFEMPLYEGLTFTVDVLNHGGTQQRFEIKNLPAWLTASPNAGQLDPLSSQKITFKVNSGLNTGYYREDIYLGTDLGFDEKLSLDLRVFTEEPAWTVDPFAYQYSMNVVADLTIDRIVSTDTYDKVSAFVNGECRGVANLTYVAEYDRYEVYLDIYSNREVGDTLELRVWDASQGVEYRHVTPVYTFAANSVKGSPSLPEHIVTNTTIVQQVVLAQGWNWVSFGLSSETLSDVDAVMKDINTQTGDQIKNQTSVDVYHQKFGWSGSLSYAGGIKNGKMYMMKVSNPGTITLIGQQADIKQSIAIRKGWNWLGYIPRFNMTLNEAFASIHPVSGDIVKSKLAFAIYEEGLGWTGSLQYLSPGEGYLYQAAKSGTLIYPEVSLLNSKILNSQPVAADDLPWKWQQHLYPDNMTVVATIKGVSSENISVAAFVGDECRGAIKPLRIAKDEYLYFITIQGEEQKQPQQVRFRIYNHSDGVFSDIQEKVVFSRNKNIGTLDQPLILTPGQEEVQKIEWTMMAVPNPFEQQVAIYLPPLTEVPLIVIRDATGKEVNRIATDPENIPSVVYWNGKNTSGHTVAKGVYFVSVETKGMIKTIKLLRK